MDPNGPMIGWIRGWIQHYHPTKYWKYRDKVIDPNCKLPKWIKAMMLFYIKRCDAFNNASMGTNINCGAKFTSPPIYLMV